MEAWHLLEKDKDVLLSLPTFPLIIKLYRVLGVWHPLAVRLVSLTRAYPSISLLIYHFASHWILSVLRQKGLWSWHSLEAPEMTPKLDSSVFSLSFSSVFSTMNSSFCGASSKTQQLLVSSIIISLGINSVFLLGVMMVRSMTIFFTSLGECLLQKVNFQSLFPER